DEPDQQRDRDKPQGLDKPAIAETIHKRINKSINKFFHDSPYLNSQAALTKVDVRVASPPSSARQRQDSGSRLFAQHDLDPSIQGTIFGRVIRYYRLHICHTLGLHSSIRA
ncbi:MAG: hypothetical protein ACI9W6_002918, partial [Motiliproteus sp.]